MGNGESLAANGGGRAAGGGGAHKATSPSFHSDVIEIGERFAGRAAVHRLWSAVHFCARRKQKGTVFIKQLETHGSEAAKYFDNGAKILRQLRHPCVLQYVDCTRTPSELRLFTEHVQALDLCIDSLCWIELLAGVRSVLEALVFLHSTAHLSHNAVCPSSVFVSVSDGGSWRLMGFEFARTLPNPEIIAGGGTQSTPPEHLLSSDFFRASKPPEFTPPEDLEMMKNDQSPTARDAFGLGKLLQYTAAFAESDGAPADVLAALSEASIRLTVSPPSARPPLTECLAWPAFTNPLSSVEFALRHLQTWEEEQREAFFESVLGVLSSLPPRVVAARLARPLLSRYVMLEERAHHELLPALLQPAPLGLLSPELLAAHVIPECIRVLRVHDSAIRCGLLRHFDLFARYVPVDQLATTVIDELLVGLADTDDRIASASLRGLATVVPLVGGDHVLESLSMALAAQHRGRRRTKLFVDGTPKANLPSPTGCDDIQSLHCISPQFAAIPTRASLPYDEGRRSDIQVLSTQFTDKDNCNDQADDEWGAGWGEEGEEEKSQDTVEEERGGTVEGQDTVGQQQSKRSTVVAGGDIKPTLSLSSLSTKINNLPSRIERRDIGAEFDVKLSSGGGKSEVDDLFAELAPEIKPAPSVLEQLEQLASQTLTAPEKNRRNKKSEKPTKDEERTAARLTFTADESEAEAGNDAWGAEDGVNWDED